MGGGANYTPLHSYLGKINMIFGKQKIIFILLILFNFLIHTEILATNFNTCQAKDSLNLNAIYTYLHLLEMSEPQITISETGRQLLVDDKRNLYSQLYESCISVHLTTDLTKSLNSAELHRLYLAIYTVAFYTNNPNHLKYLRLILSEKTSRGENVDGFLQNLFRRYVSSRQFKLAANLTQKYPKVKFPNLPHIGVDHSIKGRSLLHLNNSGTKLKHKPFVLQDGGHVVVVSSAICNPSKRFFNWLDSKVKLKNIFSTHSTWITPAMSDFYLNQTIEHNAKNPSFEMKYSYSEVDWAEISYWGTPTLYFYKDGLLISQLVGWPKEGREEELKTHLKGIDLLWPKSE